MAGDRRPGPGTLVFVVIALLLIQPAFGLAAGNGKANGHGAQGAPRADAAEEHAQGPANSSAKAGGTGPSADPPAPQNESTGPPAHAQGHGPGGNAGVTGTGGGGGPTTQGDHDTHPPGNNGTIKIDGPPWDDHPDNEPHVPCAFDIDLYGYEEGGFTASATVDLHPPSGWGTIESGSTTLDDDPNGGGTDHDGTIPIDLNQELPDGAELNPQQGYHIKVAVEVPEGSQGADTKYKVLWVNCDPATPEVIPPDPGPPVRPTAERPGLNVLGRVERQTVAAPVGPAVGELAFTGFAGLVPLLSLAAGLAATGGGLLYAGRRRARHARRA